MDQGLKNHGVRVTSAAVGINLALGILYTWSVVSNEVPAEWGWTHAAKAWPYSIACLVFSLMMVPAGRLQDKLGPRLVASIGGLLVGLGLILCSMTTLPLGYMLGFGLLAGSGIGFGYAAATPPAVKWFPSARTGLVAGIVVSGFGLASVYAAPLARWLIHCEGIPTTMLCLGIAFLVVVVCLAQLLAAPPKGYVPAGPKGGSAAAAGRKTAARDYSPLEMLGTPQFYLLWFMYACGAGAGLMIISKLATIAKEQAGYQQGFVLVAAMAVGNGAGRIIAGSLSDRLGRLHTLLGCFLFQAVLMILVSLAQKDTPLGTVPALVVLSALMGANYGANLSLFPSVTKDYYGLRNFGVNYGLVFTAWGIGGFVLALLAGWLRDSFGHYSYSYYVSFVLLLLAGLVTFAVKSPVAAAVEPPSPAAPAPWPK
jgi:OFA family oxalate/formate antiporter-like MFS transporter